MIPPRALLPLPREEVESGNVLKVLGIEGDQGRLMDQGLGRELDAVQARRGPPAAIVIDNGPEFTSRVMLQWAQDRKIDWHYIDPGTPTQNAYVESFNGRLRGQ